MKGERKLATKTKTTTAKPKKAMAKVKTKENAYVICTAKKGVFFGYTAETQKTIIERGTVTIARARMCVRWSSETHGVLGLAGIGPQKGSRVGPRVPSLACNEVTAVITCSPEAAQAWEAELWSN